LSHRRLDGMKRPVAHTITPDTEAEEPIRAPRAFTPDRAEIVETAFEPEPDPELVTPPPRRMSWSGRVAWPAGGQFVSAGLGLAADRLIRDLFASNEYLGWIGLGILAAFLVAIIALVFREYLALRRLRVLDALKADAARASAENDRKRAGAVADHLLSVYAGRADLASAREQVSLPLRTLF